MKYIVEDIVGEYAIIFVDELGDEELILTCKSKLNADLICETLNADLFGKGILVLLKEKAFVLEAELEYLKNKLNDSEQKCLICNKEQGNEKLKEQLADKDNEIEKLKAIVDMVDKYKQYDKNAKELILLNKDNCYSDGNKLIIKTDNQDKISFAVEQLEKVKEFCDGMKWAMVYLTKENAQTIQTVLDEIDNQIKQLKEGK